MTETKITQLHFPVGREEIDCHLRRMYHINQILATVASVTILYGIRLQGGPCIKIFWIFGKHINYRTIGIFTLIWGMHSKNSFFPV